jgi:hypothetical protein
VQAVRAESIEKKRLDKAAFVAVPEEIFSFPIPGRTAANIGYYRVTDAILGGHLLRLTPLGPPGVI